jgi:phospholipase C
MPLKDIETIVFVMLENRAFDHVVGYLSTAATAINGQPPMAIEGLRDDPAWLAAHANIRAGTTYPVHRLGPDVQTIDDPPHDSTTIAQQIGPSLGMTGFVDSYMTRQPQPADPGVVMGHYGPDAVPMFDFLARNFVLCDHWYAALPTGTQANRLMAMSGESLILDNASVFLPEQPLVYDWLTTNKVAWCAYQWGDFFPFFSLVPRLLPEITTSLALSAMGGRGRFRRYSQFAAEWAGSEAMPSVIFIEPEYTDGPHGTPNDDHPPTGVAKGQALLQDVYTTLTANAARWQNTMMIVTYDEHGGFFDHVSPLPMPTTVGGHAIATTGVRVPAFIVSPHVAPGVPFSGKLDHTSFLQLLADRFTPGQDYSPAVATRQARLDRLSTVLTQIPGSLSATPAVPAGQGAQIASNAAALPASSGTSDASGATDTTLAFRAVAAKIASDHPDLLGGGGWTSLAHYIATGPHGASPIERK